MGLVIFCSAENFDHLAGAVAAGKIYGGNKVWLISPPVQKIREFIDLYPDLLIPLDEEDLPAEIDPALLIGPWGFQARDSCREVLKRAAVIHLFSNRPEDRELFPGAKPFIRPVAAVTTLLVEEIRRKNIDLTGLEAGLLALGIYEATDALTSPATTAADVGAVQYLWEKGMDLELLRAWLLTGSDKTGRPRTGGIPLREKEESEGGDKPVEREEGRTVEKGTPSFKMGVKEPDRHLDGVPDEPEWLNWDSLLPLLTGEVSDRFRGRLLLLGQVAARKGSEIYLVGGVIRDLFLGKEPANDLDLVVIPEAIPLARDLQKCLGGKIISYEQLGTATLFLPGGDRLDLASARREFYPLPGALPQVEPSSLKYDLYRRDFTINSMACSLRPESFGRLFDYFGGRRDLVAGLLRTMYNLSFVEDPLRILRAVRFEGRLGFRLEENTMGCLKKAIYGRALEKVSRQRLSQEMSRIYREQNPPQLLKRLEALGALKFIYPRLQTRAETWRRLELIGQAFPLTRQWDWEKPPELEPAYITALLFDMEEDIRTILVNRIHLSRDFIHRILKACAAVPRVLSSLTGGDPDPSTLYNLLAGLPPEALLAAYAFAEGERVRSYLETYVNSLRRMRPALDGEDLIAMGLSPGPIFQQILKELKDKVLDGRLSSREEEEKYVRTLIQKGV